MHDDGDDEAPARRENNTPRICTGLAGRRHAIPKTDTGHQQWHNNRRVLAVLTPLVGRHACVRRAHVCPCPVPTGVHEEARTRSASSYHWHTALCTAVSACHPIGRVSTGCCTTRRARTRGRRALHADWAGRTGAKDLRELGPGTARQVPARNVSALVCASVHLYPR